MFTDKKKFKKALRVKLQTLYGESLDEASPGDKYTAVGNMIRDYISMKWVQTNRKYLEKGEKQVFYFSLEFLLGRLMGSNLLNLGVQEEFT
ncbi:MAG: glycogen phosphorylase, partial [Firmicutes bacterium]|nr:glycogen phosphorylase [Bacillota bacterium]